MIYINDTIKDTFTYTSPLYFRVSVFGSVIYYGYTIPHNSTISVTLNNILRHQFTCELPTMATSNTAVATTDNVMLLPVVKLEYCATADFVTLVRTRTFDNVANALPFFGTKSYHFNNDNNVKVYDDWSDYGKKYNVDSFASSELLNVTFIFPKRFVQYDSTATTYAKGLQFVAEYKDADDSTIATATLWSADGANTHTMIEISLRIKGCLEQALTDAGHTLAEWTGNVQFKLNGTFYNYGTETATTFAQFTRNFTGVGGVTFCNADLNLFCVGQYGNVAQLRLYGANKRARDYEKSTLQVDVDETRNYANNVTEKYTANTGWLTEDEQVDMQAFYATLRCRVYVKQSGVWLDVDNVATSWEEFKYKADKRLYNTELTLTCNKKLRWQYD